MSPSSYIAAVASFYGTYAPRDWSETNTPMICICYDGFYPEADQT
jgi:hypothetical protein